MSATQIGRCCIPSEGEEHCDHHPEWHDKHGCNHPDCCASPPEVDAP